MFSRSRAVRQGSLQTLFKRHNSTLLFVEHKNNVISPATLNALSAAKQLGNPVHAILTSAQPSDPIVSTVSKLPHLTSVWVASEKALEHSTPELLAPVLSQVVQSKKITHLVAANSAISKNVFPRVAALLDVAQISDIIEIESPDTFKRPIYAGNAIAKVKSKDAVKVMTIRSTAFPAATPGNDAVPTESLSVFLSSQPASEWIKEELSKSDRPELGAARVVIGGGRGMKNGENFKMLYDLADKLNGAVGASRAAVDAGFVSNDLQIGQTGKIIAPELYIAVGISGAIQHLAGMKDSKTIVAINKDPEAPIFQVSDYGLVADLFKAVPELTQEISK